MHLWQYAMLLSLALPFCARSQSLSVGDTVPSMLYHMLQKPGDSANQFVILDFWATYCVSCIENIPHLEQLQNRFGDSLRIIMVTEQACEISDRFLQKRRILTGRNNLLPVICGDTIWSKFFAHESVPHYAWLDNNGVVKYLTQSDAVNERNIATVLKNQHIITNEINDKPVPVSLFRPLFINQNGGDGSELMYFSVLSEYVKGIPSISGIFESPDRQKSFAVGFSQTIKSLFQIAYNDFENQWYIPDNRTILLVNDTGKYVFRLNGKNHYENFYNYQLITPWKSYEEMRRMMRDDLKKYFNLEAFMKKKKMKCWVLTSSDTNLIHSPGGAVADQWDLGEFRFVLKNVPVKTLERRFIYNLLEHSQFPFVNETCVRGNIDLQLDNIQLDNIESIQQALKKWKLTLKLEYREVRYLIIKEKNQPL